MTICGGVGGVGRIVLLNILVAGIGLMGGLRVSNAQPLNDDFANARVIASNGPAIPGTTTGATLEAGEPSEISGSIHSVWYKWVAPTNGIAVVRTDQPFARIACYEGGGLDALQSLGINPGRFSCQSGKTYMFKVASSRETDFNFEFGAFFGSIELPQEGATVVVGDSIVFRANLTPWDADAVFYANGQEIGRASVPPHEIEWRVPSRGEIPVYLVSPILPSLIFTPVRWFSAIDPPPVQPRNDLFANRFVIDAVPFTATVETAGATAEAGEPSHGSGLAMHSLWWTWRAPVDGLVRVLTDETWPVAVRFYLGDQLENLIPVAHESSADASAPWIPQRWIRVQSNAVYQIAVDRPEPWAFSLSVSLTPRPANDNFATATLIHAITLTNIDSQLLAATTELGEPVPSGADYGATVWYRWTAPSNGWLHVSAVGDWNSLCIYSGDDFSNLVPASSPVALNRRNATAWVERDRSYSIGVARWNHFSQHYFETYPNSWSLVYTPAPVNDGFEDRILIDGLSGILLVDASQAFDKTVWYEWIAPADGTLLTGIATPYFGEDPLSLTPLEAPPSGMTVTQGMSIKLSVYAPNPAHLIWKFYPTPANDSFSTAQNFSGSHARLSGHNYGAGREPRESKHGAEFAGRTIWYRWIAPFSGWAAWRAWSGSGAQSTRVYEGTVLTRLKSVPNKSQVVSPDGTLALHEFPAVAGKSYYFVMDSRRFPNDEGGGYFSNPPDDFEMEFSLTVLQLQAEVSLQPGGAPVLAAGFSSPDPAALANVASAEYGLVSLDTYCYTRSLAANQSGGSLLWSNPPPGYYLLVSLATNSSGGTAVLNPISLRIPPANDDFTNAYLLEGFQLTTNGPITGASREPREPAHGDPKGIGSIWWTWTAPADGPLELGLTVYGQRIGYEPSDATGITPTMSVYRMKNGKLVRIAGTRRAKYTVGCRLRVERGQTYFIAGQIPRGYYVSDCGYPAQLSLRLGAARIASSVAGATFTQPLPVTLTIEANFSLDEIQRVEFLEGHVPAAEAKVLAGSGTNPFYATWENAPQGTHMISARIHRKDGRVFTTDTAKIFVRGE